MLGYIGRHLLEQFALVRGKKAREVVFIRLGSASGHSKKRALRPNAYNLPKAATVNRQNRSNSMRPNHQRYTHRRLTDAVWPNARRSVRSDLLRAR
jgi:hypothetical protein